MSLNHGDSGSVGKGWGMWGFNWWFLLWVFGWAMRGMGVKQCSLSTSCQPHLHEICALHPVFLSHVQMWNVICGGCPHMPQRRRSSERPQHAWFQDQIPRSEGSTRPKAPEDTTIETYLALAPTVGKPAQSCAGVAAADVGFMPQNMSNCCPPRPAGHQGMRLWGGVVWGSHFGWFATKATQWVQGGP